MEGWVEERILPSFHLKQSGPLCLQPRRSPICPHADAASFVVAAAPLLDLYGPGVLGTHNLCIRIKSEPSAAGERELVGVRSGTYLYGVTE
jgi:hypothetical protein